MDANDQPAAAQHTVLAAVASNAPLAHHTVHQGALAGALWAHDCHNLVVGACVMDARLINELRDRVFLEGPIAIYDLTTLGHAMQAQCARNFWMNA